MHMIEVKGLQKAFGSEQVLKDVSFTVDKGETVAVIGYSGAGKSTMLRCLIDLEKADGGDVLIEGEPLIQNGRYADDKTARRICAKMGMVFQSFNLFPHMTVMGNLIGAPMTVKKEDKQQAIARAKEKLKLVGLEDKADAHPSELSGGQKQRVSIARIFLKNPPILILDEATSALDSVTEARIQGAFDELAKGRTTLIIAHRLSTIRNAHRIIVVDDNRIVEEGTHAQLLASGGEYAQLYNTQKSVSV